METSLIAGLLVLLLSLLLAGVMVGTVFLLIWIARKVDERRRR